MSSAEYGASADHLYDGRTKHDSGGQSSFSGKARHHLDAFFSKRFAESWISTKTAATLFEEFITNDLQKAHSYVLLHFLVSYDPPGKNKGITSTSLQTVRSSFGALFPKFLSQVNPLFHKSTCVLQCVRCIILSEMVVASTVSILVVFH